MLVLQQKQKHERRENSSRFAKGLAIAATHGRVLCVSKDKIYWVQSDHHRNFWYDVNVTEQGLTCNCMDAQQNHNVVCKHQYAVIATEVEVR